MMELFLDASITGTAKSKLEGDTWKTGPLAYVESPVGSTSRILPVRFPHGSMSQIMS